MFWMDHVPEDWISKDGRLWRDMSPVERTMEYATNPSLRRLLPKEYRDTQAARQRELRRLKREGLLVPVTATGDQESWAKLKSAKT